MLLVRPGRGLGEALGRGGAAFLFVGERSSVLVLERALAEPTEPTVDRLGGALDGAVRLGGGADGGALLRLSVGRSCVQTAHGAACHVATQASQETFFVDWRVRVCSCCRHPLAHTATHFLNCFGPGDGSYSTTPFR